MSIKVIQQSTAERREETIKIFKLIQPLLDQGYSFNKACAEYGYNVTNTKNGWFMDLVKYAKTQGYDYYDYKYSHKPKKISGV